MRTKDIKVGEEYAWDYYQSRYTSPMHASRVRVLETGVERTYQVHDSVGWGLHDRTVNDGVRIRDVNTAQVRVVPGREIRRTWDEQGELIENARRAAESSLKRSVTRAVCEEIYLERYRQDEKWGEQNHPDGTGGKWAELTRDEARAHCDRAAEAGALTWTHILREEFLEALAESDSEKLRAELIQVAAVAAAWVEAIDRAAQTEIVGASGNG